MFWLDGTGVLREDGLGRVAWVEHGFGTRVSSDWPPEGELVTLRQIHSDRVLVAERAGLAGEGDALVTDRPGLWLSVRTADCLPILIADTKHRAIAAVHAGWRGVVQEIVPKTVRMMEAQFGTRPEELIVAIGPGIGGCCFEVGPEVAVQFGLAGRTKVDLVETIIRQLRRNDGSVGQIATAELCTYCRSDLFHSYRRERDQAGRMISAIRIREGA